jgi:pSer/pThr/pTyr-binding forkhead associated (FHA) protein
VTDAFCDPPTPDRTHPSPFLKLRGRGGLLDGEFVKVPLEGTVTLGRSKRCDLSLKKSARYLLSSGAARTAIRDDLAFRAVSRRHCSVTFLAPDLVEVENHSSNGTFVDGRRVARIRLEDVRFVRHEIRLGAHGDTFEIEYGSLVDLPEDSVSR